MNYLELYRSAYTTKRLGYPLLGGIAYITMVVIRHKSLIDSAYTTKGLWYRLQ